MNVKAGHTISWSLQPHGHKKAINFGIFKHPGSGHAPTPKLPSSTFEPPPTPGLRQADAPPESQGSKNASSSATEKLKSIGLKPISWYGTCEPGRVSAGTYDVPNDEGGMYALVFDNTFAKQFSKNVTFVLLTYPTDSPPQQNHHTRHIQGPSSTTSLNNNLAPRRGPLQRDSSDSIQQAGITTSEIVPSQPSRPRRSSLASNFFTGVLQKRRRKRHQGYARRFFSLDYSSSTLSYYHNRHTLALRGAIPLSLAAIGANATTRQISIDSGAEIWHLKASNRKDFEAWKNALELASNSKSPTSPVIAIHPEAQGRSFPTIRTNPEEELEWTRIESLVRRVQTSRDAAMTIAKDTDPKYLPSSVYKADIDKVDSNPLSVNSSASGSPSESSNNGYFNEGERKSFWKRKQSSERTMPGMFKRSVSATPTFPSPRTLPLTPHAASFVPEHSNLQSPAADSLHDRCMSLLKELDLVVDDFRKLLTQSKQRRLKMQAPTAAASRYSIDSQRSEEFFDALGSNDSQLLAIQDESETEAGKSEGESADDRDDSSTDSDVEDKRRSDRADAENDCSKSAFPPKPKSLSPLPAQKVQRRTTVPMPKVQPPSLISFLRKNVGKDLSTIAMPVSANEPLSLLQRSSEQLEYSRLVDKAATTSIASTERLLLISAFAVAALSSARVKDRSVRKPFNPMLGETFELVREDRGFRFLAEKVSHRPVRMACQAESEQWSFTQAPAPTQKFWGKSAELVTEGRVRVVLHSTGDRFSWAPATSFLRNIIAGEKYVEPVGTMTINNEATGEKAIVTFKSKGMFSGRSEDVVVQSYNPHGEELPLGLVGKWTSSLTITDNGTPRKTEPIWTVDDLVPDAAKRYGLTTFAASLNEITGIEEGKLPTSDSRLRPDQRAAEEGDLEEAEYLKQKLEEAQRTRRKVMEDAGEEWRPRWFERVDKEGTEEIWRLKSPSGYWDMRDSGWEDFERIFDV